MLAKRAGLALVSTRYFSIGYLKEYFNNFILGKKSSATRTKAGLVIPFNLYDNMYCVLRKPPVSKHEF